jgi:NADH-quinone oxidoreductase subunit C
MTELTNAYIAEKIRNQFGDAILSASEPFDMLTLVVNPSIAHNVINFLKNDSEIQVQFLTDVCGAQFPEIEGQEFCVIYHLHSLTNNIRIRVKAFIPASTPTIATVSDLFSSANWQERETYDFYGILFEGHPNLNRIMNVDEMDYFPLRKEYPLEDGTRTDKEDKYFGR